MTRNCVEYALFAGESVAEVDPKWCPRCIEGYATITDVLRSDALLSKKKYMARCLKDDFTCTFKPAPGTPWGTGHQQFYCPACDKNVKAIQTKRSEGKWLFVAHGCSNSNRPAHFPPRPAPRKLTPESIRTMFSAERIKYWTFRCQFCDEHWNVSNNFMGMRQARKHLLEQHPNEVERYEATPEVTDVLQSTVKWEVME